MKLIKVGEILILSLKTDSKSKTEQNAYNNIVNRFRIGFAILQITEDVGRTEEHHCISNSWILSSNINYFTICTIMAISYKSQDEGVHNGWKYNISLDWKDDLVISISPSYYIQLPPQGSANYEAISALRNKMININMDNTHRFTKKIRFLGIFSSPVPQTHKGHEFAREYIDSKLGRFHFDQVYRAILDDLKKYT